MKKGEKMTDLTKFNIYAYIWADYEEIQIYADTDALKTFASALAEGNSIIKIHTGAIEEEHKNWIKRHIDTIELKICEGNLLLTTEGTKIIIQGEKIYLDEFINNVRNFIDNVEDKGHIHIERHNVESNTYYVHPKSNRFMISALYD